MLVADEYLGPVDDPEIAERVENADSLTVTLDDTERRRSRVRTTADDGTGADDGTDLGIVVGRELRDGDVILADGRPVVVSLEPVEAMALDFGGVDGSPTTAATVALELGHAVGNRHWDLAVEGERAFLPVTEDRERMEHEVEPHLPDGVTVGYESVSPALFDDGTPDHSHDTDGDRDLDHDHGHRHDHNHTHGHDHDHGHDDTGTHTVRSIDPDGGEES